MDALPQTLVAADPFRATAEPRPGSFRWTHGFFNRLVTLSDIAGLTAVGIAMVGLLPRPGLGWHAMMLNAIQITIFVLIQQSIMGYRFESYLKLSTSLRQGCIGLSIAFATGAVCALVIMPMADDMLFWFVEFLPIQLAVVSLVRIGARAAAIRIHRTALMRRNTVIIGDGAEAQMVIASLTAPGRHADFKVIGTVAPIDFAERGVFAGTPLLGGLAALSTVSMCEEIDLVVIAMPLSKTHRLAEVFDSLHAFPADVVMVLDDAIGRALHGPVGYLEGHPVVSIAKRPLKGSKAIIKFVEDQVICSLVLLALSPLMLLIALLIRLESTGPALFRQDRVGQNGRVFRIYKFRTMTVDPSDDGTVGTTARTHGRITRVGRILRASSLDELAQLLNVVLGDMSVVGPRPYVPGMLVEGERFEDLVRNFRARHLVKPGITGLAQSNGIRSNALRKRSGAVQSVQQDLQYIARWTLWLDIQIIVRTVLLAMVGPEVF